MRAHLPSYELKTPTTLQETLALLTREPGCWRPIAGGTDLMVLFEAGKLKDRQLVSLWALSELRGIEESPGFVTLGALTTYSQVRASSLLGQEFPMLGQAAGETGAVAIQNRGTLGGNIVNASPVADSPPALLVYDAEVELVSTRGARWVRYADFHTGYKQTQLAKDELVKRIRLPRPTGDIRQYYRKVGTRKAQAISKVCFAGWILEVSGSIGEARIALGGVAATPTRMLRTEAFLTGKSVDAALVPLAQAELIREITPIDDLRSTAEYRSRVAANLLAEFLKRSKGTP